MLAGNRFSAKVKRFQVEIVYYQGKRIAPEP